MGRGPLPAILSACAALLLAQAAMAQEAGGDDPAGTVLPQLQQLTDTEVAPDHPEIDASILVLNQERLLSQSLYGQRIQREVAQASADLRAENREIEARLTEEELRLTELRRTLPAAEFRPMAEEFDTRVEAIRSAQEAKTRALQTQAEAAQNRFFEIAFPILLDIVRSRGAAVLMDNRAVLLSADGVDITEEALARIDAEIGEGDPEPLIDLGGVSLPQPRPAPEP